MIHLRRRAVTGDRPALARARIVYTVLGGYITARLAPHAPMRHVFVLGILGLVIGTVGAIAAIRMASLGPNWYPIALAISGFPCVWIGGLLYERTRKTAG